MSSFGTDDSDVLLLAERVDLPGHDDVVAMLKTVERGYDIVLSLGAAIVAYFALTFVVHLEVQTAALIAVGLAASSFIVLKAFLPITRVLASCEEVLCLLFAAVAMFASAYHFYTNLERGAWFEIVLYTAGCTILGAIIGMKFGSIVEFALSLCLLFVALASVPISLPILFLWTAACRRRMRLQFKHWHKPNGQPYFLFRLTKLGYSIPPDEPLFVASPNMRCNGSAAEAGIPKFTIRELQDSRFVNAKLAEFDKELQLSDGKLAAALMGAGISGAVIGSAGGAYLADMELPSINPGSGLPTVGGVGTHDVAGNSWGSSDHMT